MILDIMGYIACCIWMRQFHIGLRQEYLIPFGFGLWRQEHNALWLYSSCTSQECSISIQKQNSLVSEPKKILLDMRFSNLENSTYDPISLKFDLERRLRWHLILLSQRISTERY